MYSLATWLGHKSRRFLLGGTKYGWRRLFRRYMQVPFWAIGVLLLLASVPFVAGEFHGWLLGSSFSVIGLASGLVAFARTTRQHEPGPTSRPAGRSQHLDRLVRRGVPALWRALGVLWLCMVGSGRRSPPECPVVHGPCRRRPLAIVTGFAVDLNLITIHRFYRDRLMEAFLPDVDEALRNRTAPARQADPDHPVQHVRPHASDRYTTSSMRTSCSPKSNERTYRRGAATASS